MNPPKLDQFRSGEGILGERVLYVLIEAFLRENVFVVFNKWHKHCQSHFDDREPAIKPGGFMTEPEGLQSAYGRRFVCFRYEDRGLIPFWEETLESFCKQEGRRWGVIRDDSLELNTGERLPAEQLEIIETNPVGRRASDFPPPPSGSAILSARNQMGVIAQLKAKSSEPTKDDAITIFLSLVFESLKKALALGEIDRQSLATDPTFVPLHEMNEFEELINLK